VEDTFRVGAVLADDDALVGLNALAREALGTVEVFAVADALAVVVG
jgi:hypothetical protein